MRLEAKTREKANEVAGELLPSCRPSAIPKEEESSKASDGLKFDNIEIEGLVKREDFVKAPLFNVTDGSGQTQEDIGRIIEKAFGIKVDYVSASETLHPFQLEMVHLSDYASAEHNVLIFPCYPLCSSPLSQML